VDERRARIFDDLRGVVHGELCFEPLERAVYAHDASLYEIDPLGAVMPRDADDVVQVVRYAAENRLPIHVRGAGSDTGGGSLGPGLVLDLGRHLRKIVEIGPETVVVEPGVVPELLNAHLAPLGRRLEPVPCESSVATLGGLIAVDAAGARSLRYGSLGDHVARLRAVLAHGEVADLGFEPWPAFESEPADSKAVIVKKLYALFKSSQARLQKLAAAAPRNRAGYRLDRAASEQGIDLGKLVAGSEGTLAIVLQAQLRTVPVPPVQGVLLLPFTGLGDAAAFVSEIVELALLPSSCDLFDRRSLSLAREADASIRSWIDEPAEAVLCVEFEGEDAELVQDKLRLVSDRAKKKRELASDPFWTTKRAECERALSWRRLIEPLVMRLRPRLRPTSFVDDIAVPLERLSPVVQKLQAVLQQQNLTWAFDAYAGEGRIRLRPFLDLSDPGDRAKLEPLARRFCDVVWEAGGTIASAQGWGLARTQFLRQQCGELVPVFREIKDAFDPENQLNPGKVIGDDPHLLLRDLKVYPRLVATQEIMPEPPSSWLRAKGEPAGPREAPADVLEGVEVDSAKSAEPTVPAAVDIHPALRWPELSLIDTALACNACGACRTLDPALRMCPSFRGSHREAASPRAQANLVRQLLAGEIDPRLWGAEEFNANADLCIHCKQCRTECPSGVDVSSLMLEAKAAYVEKHGLPTRDWISSRIELWARLGSQFPPLFNSLMSRRGVRWLLERLLGLSRRRVLPPVRAVSFTRRAARLGLNKPRPQQTGPRVVYFVDVFANYFDQELAEAVVAVLRNAGVNVYVPARQRASGMSYLVVGDIEHARDSALANLRVLANAVRDGYTVICSEPTAALMLRQEYVKLTEDLDAELVAANTMDVGHYLMGLAGRGQLPEPNEPLNAKVGYHQPCHLRALNVGTPGMDLLRSVLQLDVEFINRGCSGMGGTYGLARDRFWTSLRAGRGLLKRLRDGDIEIGATECAACRIQMEQGQTKRTLHPIKLLSLGYGLNPALRQHFKDSKRRHVIS
jgi:FAD/FMN-containing dehydrogenase/Fe-S oxidoreductase